MQHAKQYFEQQSDVDRLYFTSDGLAFFEEQNAINHAKRLPDKTVAEKTREEVESELELLTGDWEDDLEDDLLDEDNNG